MIIKFKKIKLREKLASSKNRGMTYFELIVVLSIFAIMSSVTLFNYQNFQKRVDLKNMTNDIALQIVQAQKDAMSGKLDDTIPVPVNWKPTYGVRFVRSNPNSFKYFAEISGLGYCEDDGGGDCSNFSYYPEISINKGDKIVSLEASGSCVSEQSLSDLNIVFRRPDSSAKISSASLSQQNLSGDCYAVIVISTSDGSIKTSINVYPSGKVEMK